MNNIPLVSVISPAYNHGKYIEECIKSILRQSFPDWEMLIMDDGSTDDTAEIAERLSENDSRIMVFRQNNIGIFRLAETYNKALANSHGKYICILECDDLWEPDKLKRQTETMEKDPSVVVTWGKAMAFHSGDLSSAGIYPKTVPEGTFYQNDPPGNILNILFIENPIPAATMMIRKSALSRTGGFIQRPGLPLVDLSTLLELADKGTFHYDDRILAKWRVYEAQTTKTYPVQILEGRRDLCLEKFRSLDPEIKCKLSVSESELIKHFKKQHIIACARSGRYKLIRKDFRGARSDYKKAIFAPGFQEPVWRMRAITGYIFSLFHKDIEGLSRLLGKESYKKR
ncbi:MAG: glycosyltransferase [Bacteroidota bacterium]|nr:glycosyltransferase [Bacteroidota bacterium]